MRMKRRVGKPAVSRNVVLRHAQRCEQRRRWRHEEALSVLASLRPHVSHDSPRLAKTNIQWRSSDVEANDITKVGQGWGLIIICMTAWSDGDHCQFVRVTIIIILPPFTKWNSGHHLVGFAWMRLANLSSYSDFSMSQKISQSTGSGLPSSQPSS